MTLRDFIKQNKDEIDTYIKSVVPENKLNDKERQLWIMNDEGLYNWAKAEGVRI